MTALSTELDFSVLEQLDFPTPCAIPGHGTESHCDQGPAVWIAEKSHECNRKVAPICDRYKRVMEEIGPDDLVKAPCGHVIPYKEHFRVVGKL